MYHTCTDNKYSNILYSFRWVHLKWDVFVTVCGEKAVTVPSTKYLKKCFSHLCWGKLTQFHTALANLYQISPSLDPSFSFSFLWFHMTVVLYWHWLTHSPLCPLFVSTEPHLVLFSAHKDITDWPFVLILRFEILLICIRDVFYFPSYWSVVHSS